MRRGHLRGECGGVEDMMLEQFGVGVGVERAPVAGLAAVRGKPGRRRGVGRDQPRLGAEFGGHVGQGHALLHRQRRDRLAGIFDRLVATAIHAQPSAQRQHHVLGDDPGPEPVFPFDQDRFGNLEPDLAGRQHACHLGRADPEHIGAEGAAGRRMAVAAHNEHAGPEMAAFGQDDVADALAVMEGDLALARPLPGQFKNARALVGVARHEMIGYQHHFLRIKQADAQLAQDRLDPARAARIVNHGEIDRGGDDLSRRDRLAAGRACDDLLRQRLRHHTSPR